LFSSYYDCSIEKITSFLSGLLETPHSCHGIEILWTIQTNTPESVLYINRRALQWKDPFGIWTMLQSLSLYLALLTSKNDTADKGGNSITPIRYRFMYRKKEQKYLATKWSCPGLFSVQKKKVVMGYLFSSRKESRRKKE